MGYWDKVVSEVTGEDDGQCTFSYTNVRLYKKLPKAKIDEHADLVEERGCVRKKYYLGANFPELYFTQMELNTLIHVFGGGSTAQIALELSLSKRTVEYYMKNMKVKLGCKYRAELMTKVLSSDLIELLREHINGESIDKAIKLTKKK
jgi:DNA-binding CsgD family transcriptional regulator